MYEWIHRCWKAAVYLTNVAVRHVVAAFMRCIKCTSQQLYWDVWWQKGINKGKRVLLAVFCCHVQFLLFLTSPEKKRLQGLFVSTPAFCPGLWIINLLWVTDRWPTLFFSPSFGYARVDTRHTCLFKVAKVVNVRKQVWLAAAAVVRVVIMTVDKPFNLLPACSHWWADLPLTCWNGVGTKNMYNCRIFSRGLVEYGSCTIRPVIDSCQRGQTKGDVGHLSALPVGWQTCCGQEFTTKYQLINGLWAAQKLSSPPGWKSHTVCPAVDSVFMIHDGIWCVQLPHTCWIIFEWVLSNVQVWGRVFTK